MTPMAEDMNTIAITGLIMRPVAYARPVRCVELKIVNSPAVTDIVVHVLGALRRVPYTLGPGNPLLVRGQLVYSQAMRLPNGGQPCIKASVMAPLERHRHRQHVAHTEA
jgi:hypothetical protein